MGATCRGWEGRSSHQIRYSSTCWVKEMFCNTRLISSGYYDIIHYQHLLGRLFRLANVTILKDPSLISALTITPWRTVTQAASASGIHSLAHTGQSKFKTFSKIYHIMCINRLIRNFSSAIIIILHLV